MQKKLYLASKSVQRGRLLKDAGISFDVISQDADERSCDWGMPMQKLTEHIANLKMEAAEVPEGQVPEGQVPEGQVPEGQVSGGNDNGEKCWIITADSLCIEKRGEISGKSCFGQPSSHEDAVRMVKAVREGALAGTAFCIDRRVWNGSVWHTEERYNGYAQGECVLDVPDHVIEWYFKRLKELSGLNYMKLAGAFSITGLGAQFFKSVVGSYTAILGLPMYEVRLGLEKMDFF